MKVEEEGQLTEESRLKLEKHQRAHMRVDTEVCLVLEGRRRAGEDNEDQQYGQLKAEEEAHLVEKARLKSEEEDLRLKDEDKARLVEEARLKFEQEDQAYLKAEEEA